MKILRLIRFKNLFMIALVQCLIKFVYFNLPQFTSEIRLDTALSTNDFTLLVLATLCLAAAGNIINDINDVEADIINKPNKVIIGKHISENMGYNLFIGLTIIGIGLGTYVSWQIGKNNLATIFLIISALLYWYATTLKRTPFIGNVIISILVASSILIVGLFELIPMINDETRQAYLQMFSYLFDYGIFAFMINLVREVVKDLEDVDGDHKAGYNTLPILLGRNRVTKIALVLNILTIVAIFYYTLTYLFNTKYLLFYFIFLIIGPLLYCTVKLVNAKTKKQFHLISTILKITMLLGMLSLIVINFE